MTGKTTSADLTLDLISSPVSNEALQIGGKAIVATLTAGTAQGYGFVTDNKQTVPVVIFNEYGKGRALLYTFDLLNLPDEARAAALMVNSINHVRPLEHRVTALDSVPVASASRTAKSPLE